MVDSLDGVKGPARSRAMGGSGQVGAWEGGGRYPLSAAPLAWSEMDKLLAGDGAAGDNFGYSVSLSGDTVLVGAHDGNNGSHPGSAYVFVRSAAAWAQQGKLLADDGAATDSFGRSVSLSGDTALIGAFRDDDNGDSSGSAYVFVRSAAAWAQQDKLLAVDGAASDYFGTGVSLSGNTALVAATGDDDRGGNAGAAYVFVRSAASWAQQDKLLAVDGAAFDNLGVSVSLSDDAALVGADNQKGAAYVFVRSAASWAQQDKLLAVDGAAGDDFGGSMSLSGNTALVGASGDDDLGGNSGSAYVFVRNAATWVQQDKLLAGGGVANDYFGGSVSLNGDTALVGASGDDDLGGSSGAAYVFARSAATWVQQDKLLAGDGTAGDWFGGSVSLSADTALVGARGDADNGSFSGSAYVFGLLLAGGQPCSAEAACASKFCVDGFCCESACGDACEACNVTGNEGLCTPLDRGTVPTSSCSGHLCDGASGACQDNCAGDGDCASTHYCQGALACVSKKADGQRCDGDSVCLSGHCVDGICCAEACDGGCGSCIVAGREGACTPLEKGYPGIPSCTPYLCDGGHASCPSACSAHGDCAPDGHCSESVCMPDQELGVACSDDDACTTSHCTDGVCCLAETCGAYRCGPGGTCEDACSSSAQCAPGYECNSDRVCDSLVPIQSEASESGSCHLAGVAAAHGTPPWRWLGGLAWLAGLGLVRGRRRQGCRASEASTLRTP